MIWSLIIGLFVGLAASGSGNYRILDTALDEWESAIKKHVDDESRQEKTLAIIKKARKDIAVYNEPVSQAFVHYFKVDNDYNATIEDYRESLEEINESFGKVDSWMLDIRFEAKGTLTDAEWKMAIGRVQDKTGKMNKKMVKNLKKAEKKLKKQVGKYEKKFETSYERASTAQ